MKKKPTPSLVKWPKLPQFQSEIHERKYDEVESLKKTIGMTLAKLRAGDVKLSSAAAEISRDIERIIELTEKRVKQQELFKKMKPMLY